MSRCGGGRRAADASRTDRRTHGCVVANSKAGKNVLQKSAFKLLPQLLSHPPESQRRTTYRVHSRSHLMSKPSGDAAPQGLSPLVDSTEIARALLQLVKLELFLIDLTILQADAGTDDAREAAFRALIQIARVCSPFCLFHCR